MELLTAVATTFRRFPRPNSQLRALSLSARCLIAADVLLGGRLKTRPMQNSSRATRIETLRLILHREKGCPTPIEHFIASILHLYQWAEDSQEGVTVEQIETDLNELR